MSYNYKKNREHGKFLSQITDLITGSWLYPLVFIFFMLGGLFFWLQNNPYNSLEQLYLKAVVNNPRGYSQVAAISDTSIRQNIPREIDKSQLSSNYHTAITDRIGILISSFTIILIFLTYMTQRREGKKSHFKQHFFEMLKIHCDNVKNLKTKGVTGREAFNKMYYEMVEIAKVTEVFFAGHTRQDVISISYIAFFWGVGEYSSPMLKNQLYRYYSRFGENIEMYVSKLVNEREERLKQGKCILDGHQSHLGHYFRHLFQMVKFIHEEQSLNRMEKYFYAKTLRAQFTNFELLIFFFNSISPMGQPWDLGYTKPYEKLICCYEILKNMPLNLTLGVDAKKIFPMNYEFG